MIHKERLIKTGKFLGKLAITLAALFLVYRHIKPDTLKTLLLEADFSYLLLALTLFTAAKVLEARRANVFFRIIGIIMSETMNTKLYLLGMFYNLFLPGGIGGDSYRVYWLQTQFQTRLKALIAAVLLNRINSLVALVCLLLLSCIYVSDLHPALPYAFILIPIVMAGYHFILSLFLQQYTSTTLPATAYSFLIRLLQVSTAHCVLYALGIHQNYGVYWFIFLIAGIIFMLPITVGGVGSRELVFLFGAQYLPMLDLNACIAMSLIIYCMRALVALGGIYYLMRPERIIDNS